MGEACGDGEENDKNDLRRGKKRNFFGKKVLLGERFRIKGLQGYTSYKMAISAQNPMLKVNYFLEVTIPP